MLNILKNTINRVFASGVDSDASAFITATGLSGTTQKSAITTLVKDLKASGLWSKMKAVYPMVTDNRNLLSYTEDFSNGAWGKVAITISTNTATAPNGTLTADSLVEDTASNSHLTHNSAPLSIPTGNLTSSIYVKKANRDWFYLNLYNGSTSLIAWFNLNAGVVGTVQSGLTASIVDAGNGWFRLSATRNIATTNNAYVQYGASNADNVTNYTGNGLVASYIWGAQYEVNTTPSTYQPILTTPAAFMASQMKYNLKDARDLDAAFRLTWSGGWTYSATGATPNGTNAYADTKLNDSILTPNSSHLSFYSRTNAFGPAYDIGLFNGTNGIWMGVGYSNGIRAGVFQTGASGELSLPLPNSLGFYVATKNGSTTNTAYKNGANVINGVKPDTTATNTTVYLGALNQNGTPGYGFSTKQIGFATIGNGLSDQDNMLFNQIVEKYQVALSRGVQAAQSFYYNSAYSNEANTYLYSTQITGTTQVSAINTLINGLKANNLWAKMKAVYPFVTDKTLQADMAAQMKFNLVNPQDSDAAFRLAFSGGWTYSTNGAQPNGTNGYADTKFSPSANLTANSSHLSIYSRTTIGNLPQSDMGSYSVAANDAFTLAIAYSNVCYMGSYAFGAAVNYIDFANTDSRGYYVNTRTSSTLLKGFKNNILGDTSTTSVTGVLPTLNTTIGAENFNGTATSYSTKQYAFATIGTGLSDAEVAILTQLVTDYQTTLSRNI